MLKRISALSLSTIVLLSLLIKLSIFCYVSPWNKNVEQEKIVVSDSWGYEQMAENLLKYHSYGIPADTFHVSNYSDYQLTGYLSLHPDTYRMPLYPSFMAAVYFIAGIKPYLVILFQILLSLFSVVLVYRISALLFKQAEVSKIASLLFALDIHSAFVANQLLTDTLFVLLFLASTYFFLKGLMNNKLIPLLASGIFLGLSALVRGMVLFYPFVIALIVFVFSRQHIPWKFKALFCHFAAFSCLIGVWYLRNDMRYGHAKLSTEEGSGLLIYYVAFTEAKISHQNVDSLRIKYQKQADSLGFKNEKDVFKQSDIYKELAVSYIKKHKAAYIKAQILGGMNMYLAIGNASMSKFLGWDNTKHEEGLADISTKRILENFTNNKKEATLGILILIVLAIQYLGACFGMYSLWRHKEYIFLFLFLLTAIYITAITGVVGTYRYKLAIVPFICIVAGYGCFKIKRQEPRIS